MFKFYWNNALSVKIYLNGQDQAEKIRPVRTSSLEPVNLGISNSSQFYNLPDRYEKRKAERYL